MLVAVGSRNPAKTAGVETVFREAFGDVRVVGVDSPSRVGVQPVGLQRILRGALNRARFALTREEADFGVGVEAGVFRLDGKYLNVQLAVISDRKTYSVGSSAGFMLPEPVGKDLVASGRELGAYSKELTGRRRVDERLGIVHYVTNGLMSRVDMTEQSVRTALAPWLNRPLYGLR